MRQWTTKLVAGLSIVAMSLAASCDKSGDDEASADRGPVDHRPHMRPEFLPEAVSGLVLGESQQADVLALFPSSRVDADHSLGGTMSVQLNDRPAIVVANPYWPGEPEITLGFAEWTFWFVGDDADSAVMTQFGLLRPHGEGTHLCAWVAETIGSLEGATTCRHTNRYAGEEDGYHFYCIGNADGSAAIEVTCEPSGRGPADRIGYRIIR